MLKNNSARSSKKSVKTLQSLFFSIKANVIHHELPKLSRISMEKYYTVGLRSIEVYLISNKACADTHMKHEDEIGNKWSMSTAAFFVKIEKQSHSGKPL